MQQSNWNHQIPIQSSLHEAKSDWKNWKTSDHLSFQVSNHVADGAIFWESYAMDYNLTSYVSQWHNLEINVSTGTTGKHETNLIFCCMVECNFKGFQTLQFWQWNV